MKKGYIKGVQFLFLFLSFGMIPFVTADYEFNGTIYDIDGNALNNTLVNITIYDISGGFTVIGYNSTTSNATGWFNVTVTSDNNWMYQVVMTHTNNTYGNIDYVGQNMPAFPEQVLSQIAGTSFYLHEAGTINITAVNATGQNIPFNYQLKDQKLGYEIAGNMEQMGQTTVTEAVIHVPKDRNYSIMVFPNASMPGTFNWNNFSSTNDYTLSDDVSTYNATTNTLEKQLNLTMGHARVSGYVNVSGITTWDDLDIVAYMMEPGDMVHSQFGKIPNNLSAFFETGGTDIFNLSTGITDFAGFYNISLPSTVEHSEMLLMAVAKNGSNYYMGFHNLSLDYDTYPDGEGLTLNFTFMNGALGTEANISIEGVDGQTTNVSTNLQIFNIINESNVSLENVFAHIETTIDYTSYGVKQFTWMSHVEQGGQASFSLPLLNTTGIEEMNVFVSGGNYAPKSLDWTVGEINTNNNITIGSFEPGVIGGSEGASLSGLKIALFKSNTTCDVPSPSEECVIGASEGGEDFGDFDPIAATLGGGKLSFRMGLLSSGIIIHYVNVDLLASGAPDANFDGSASESTNGGFDSAMKFGSQGPKIYDYALISMPYTEGSTSVAGLDETQDVNLSIPTLFDEDLNVLWNVTTNGTNGTLLGANHSHYEEKASDWEILLGGITCTENVSIFNATTPCYIDTTNNRVWIRIPHFSTVQSSIAAAVTTVASESGDGSSGGSSGGGKTYTPTEEQLETGYDITLSKGSKVVFEIEGEEHTVTLDEIEDDIVTVTLQSDPITLTLQEGETQKADTNNDGYYDVQVHLEEILTGFARFTITTIHEEVFEEDEDLQESPITGNAVDTQTTGDTTWKGWLFSSVLLLALIAFIGYFLWKKKHKTLEEE